MTAKRVLLLEDNPLDLELAQQELSAELGNCEFIAPPGDADFQAALRNSEPDLVVMDRFLGWTDGFAAVRTVRSRWPDCALIMFTGTGNEAAAVEAMKLGLDDYVAKYGQQKSKLAEAARGALA